ncbi:MAG: protein adenylyltransferase SelO [Steroidobacteraceae bacterium]
MRLGFEHSYAALPSRFHTRVAPSPVADPRLVLLNRGLARELGLDPDVLEPQAAAMLSGNRLPEDAEPIAMAYAGHQFGDFVPSLGDGRAILLGEIRAQDSTLRDIQLKGAGLTRFSRNGDGRAALGPMLREYLVSEAMHALGVPSTRSLAVVTTGEQVFREQALPGAVLTRVAASHVRVGTFQYFAARGDQDGVRALLEYVIARHYPQAGSAAVPALAVLEEVSRRQAALIAHWMLLGFIHGVMNTDNMSIAGETIDYGPCAFMDEYDPSTVFSSIDTHGRYAFRNQPTIAQWNLARLAETLLPLIDAQPEKAVELAILTLESFTAEFDARFLAGMRRKLGLSSAFEGGAELVRRLLLAMERSHADFTLTFRTLALAAESSAREPELRALLGDDADSDSWLRQWRTFMARDPEPLGERIAGMRASNPAFIPRNHRVHAALEAAEAGDYGPFHALLEVLRHPFETQPERNAYAQPPRPEERVRQTFCGT